KLRNGAGVRQDSTRRRQSPQEGTQLTEKLRIPQRHVVEGHELPVGLVLVLHGEAQQEPREASLPSRMQALLEAECAKMPIVEPPTGSTSLEPLCNALEILGRHPIPYEHRRHLEHGEHLTRLETTGE